MHVRPADEAYCGESGAERMRRSILVQDTGSGVTLASPEEVVRRLFDG